MSSGWIAVIRISSVGGVGRLSMSSVFTIPGSNAVKRTPRACSSALAARTNWSTPAFDAW